MGCICSKGAYGSRLVEKESKKSSKRSVASLRKDEAVVEVDNGDNEVTLRLISEVTEENVPSAQTSGDEGKKMKMAFQKNVVQLAQSPDAIETKTGGQPGISRVFSVRNGVDGAQAAAGWPSWLTAVAGEAIKGWLPRKADSFEKLDKIGQGTYSSVYRARDLETGKVVALKKVRFVNMDPESVRFMAREIIVLRRLDHPNVMKLEGLVTSKLSGSLFLVFEYMEHDLAGLAASHTITFTEPQIKCYMLQLLHGLQHCHSRGILHRDIKGSNLLINHDGNLKIGDFGLATFFHNNQKHPLTSRVVTLWYRPPELLLGATSYGAAVDLWSSGCILAELFAGKPIMPGRTEVEQLHKIFKLCGSPSEDYWKMSKLPHATIFKPQHPYKRRLAETFKDFPRSALKLLDSLLAVEPEQRGSTAAALQSEFFMAKPLPCDPSSLPKNPPSKEFDVKLRNEDKRRAKVTADEGHGLESTGMGVRESKAATAVVNAELQKRLAQQNPKSSTGKYNLEDGRSGFSIDPFRGTTRNGLHHSQLVRPVATMNVNASEVGTVTSSQKVYDSSMNYLSNHGYNSQGAELSKFSISVGVRSSSQLDPGMERSVHPSWLEGRPNGIYSHLSDAESTHHILDRSNSSYKKHEQGRAKESIMGYGLKKNRIHYSGPLIHPGRNIDEMLKEHERQIQQAVRKARLEYASTKSAYSDNGQAESLLAFGGNY